MGKQLSKIDLSVEEWNEEINKGLEYRKQYGLEDSWSRLEALFYNVHDSQANSGPNIIMSTGDAYMSSMSVPSAYVTVKARRSDVVSKARLQETVDNDLLDELEMPMEFERAVLSDFLFGKGILKIGYDSEFGYSPKFDLGGSRHPVGMTLTQYDKFGQSIEFGRAESGMPWMQAVMPHDFVVPWGTFSINSSPWVAHRVIRHIDEIKGDPKYQTRGLQPNMSMVDFVKSYESTLKGYRIGQGINPGMSGSRDVEYCELWEIHDRRTGKILVICNGCDTFLRNEIDVLQLEGGLPFVEFSTMPRTRNFWSTPNAYYLEQVQAELSDIAIQAQKQRRGNVLKFIYDEDAFDDDELETMLSSDVCAAIKAKNGDGTPLTNKIIPFQAPFDQGLRIQEQGTRQNAREMVGLSANQVGEYNGQTHVSATETNVVNNASTLRMDRRQSALATSYEKVFRIMNPIIWRFWTTPQMTQVMGKDGQQLWLQFTGQHLKGDFSYSVGFSTGGNETLQARRQNALQLYSILRQDPMMDPTGLAQFLNLAYNDPEFTGVFKDGALNGQLMQQMQAAAQGAPGQQPGAQSQLGGSSNFAEPSNRQLIGPGSV